MKIRFLAVVLLLGITATASAPYPTCSGNDCVPDCGANCAPPPVPCPAAGYPWCS